MRKRCTSLTRWYPRGIQILVSTYVLGQYEFFLSAKICLILNFLGEGGRGYPGQSQNSKYSKCQDLPNFAFSREGGISWASQNSKYSKCQDLPNFALSRGGGGGYPGQVKTQNTLSAKIFPILYFRGEGYSGQVQTQNTLSANICLILHFREGGILGKSKLKII